MKKFIAAIAVLSVFTTTAALAGPPAKGKKATKATKVADVWVCPMTLSPVIKGKEAGTPVVVDGKRVHFCCGGCPDEFAKLSAADKKAKVAAAVKKAGESTKTKTS